MRCNISCPGRHIRKLACPFHFPPQQGPPCRAPCRPFLCLDSGQTISEFHVHMIEYASDARIMSWLWLLTSKCFLRFQEPGVQAQSTK